MLKNEFSQMMKEGFITYLMSPWNYLDIVPPILMICFAFLVVLGFFDNDDVTGYQYKNMNVEGTMQSIMSLFIWLKFLYFLRIFSHTGYLIRIIIDVMDDMKYFLLILLLTITAFGDAMYQVSSSNKPGSNFIEGGLWSGVIYEYLTALGNFDTSNFGTISVFYVWTIFLISTVVNMIIMLNLLIAIISVSFDKINSVSDQASY
jgi:hypothetical protein